MIGMIGILLITLPGHCTFFIRLQLADFVHSIPLAYFCLVNGQTLCILQHKANSSNAYQQIHKHVQQSKINWENIKKCNTYLQKHCLTTNIYK